jgi:hypothetical protein
VGAALRQILAAAWLAGLLASASAFADGTAVGTDQSAQVSPCSGPGCVAAGRIWVGADYILWHVSGDKLPALVTTSPIGTPQSQAGVLSNPATTVLFGNTSVNDGWRSGGRVQAGYWLDDQHSSAIEAGFFGLGDAGTSFNASSSTTPILARPFTDATIGLPSAELVAFPGSITGQISAQENNDLLGANIAWRRELCSDCGDRISALIGYRYLRATDHLTISDSLTGNTSAALATVTGSDEFSAMNNFHGADLGLTGRITRGLWTIDWLGKVAIGVNVSDGSINGSSTITPTGSIPVAEPGNFLALSSNIGHFTTDRFAIAPAASLKVSYAVTPQIRVSAGYELLYWSNVLRPGGMIDTTINPNLLPPGALVGGPNRPQVQLNGTGLLAHGINLGLTIDF